MVFIDIQYMLINQFALQHIAGWLGEYRTYNAHQSLGFNLLDGPPLRCEHWTSVRGEYYLL